nr:formate dehydrogenase accessory protein FdhE [Chloroflexota bacterium]
VLASAGEGEGLEAAALAALSDLPHLPALELIAAAIAQDADQIDTLAMGLGVDGDALAVVAHLAALPLLLACGRGLSARIPALWRAGSCPICGAWPAVAEVRGLERVRHLRCGRCGGDWVQTAAGCLFCGTTDHEQLGSLVPETGAEARRVETCIHCRGYVKAIATIRPWTAGGVALADLASVELDLAAIEHDYARPAGPAFDLGLVLTEAPRLGRV